MTDITLLLDALQRGEPDAAGALLAQVYVELRRLAAAKMAREQPGQTLQPTALVHEAWLRLVNADGRAQFENSAHFFGAAAEAMRRILVERARRKLAVKHGGGGERIGLDEVEILAPAKEDELLAVDEALERLAEEDPQKAELVKLRYFAGLSMAAAAHALGISERTAGRHWSYARAWLLEAISAPEDASAKKDGQPWPIPSPDCA